MSVPDPLLMSGALFIYVGEIPVDACPGLTPRDRELLRVAGISRAYVGRIIDSPYVRVCAVPLVQLASGIYAGYMPEIGDPCIIEIGADEVLIYPQYEASESILALRRLRPQILAYFNSLPHSLEEALSTANRLFTNGPELKGFIVALLVPLLVLFLVHAF